MKSISCQHEFEPVNLSDYKKKNAKKKLIADLQESLSISVLADRCGLKKGDHYKLYSLVEKHGLFKKQHRKQFIKTIYVQPDQHVPFHDKACWSIQMQYLEENQPDIFVNLGDFEDCLSLSEWDKDKRKPHDHGLRKREVKEIKKRKEQLDDLLDGSIKVIHEGNHEYRARRFTDKNPKLQGMLEMFEVLDWGEDGWRVYPYKSFSQIGNMRFTHDIYMGKYNTFKSVDKLLSDVVYGHTHTYQVFTREYGLEGTFKGITAGHGIDVKEARRMYLGNSPVSWVHGFLIIHMDILTGKWSHTFNEIADGEMIADGKIWRAK
jgi:hypothetical protein